MRIGIVNDLSLAVRVLTDVLEQAPDLEVAWVAENGKEAVDLAASKSVDLILMDLVMPEMDGVEATRRIMESSPCAILIVTATVSGHASMVFEAMGWGALAPGVSSPLVAIGASTGGPKALGTILVELAHSFDGTVVIVQHIDSNFADGLAKWLDEQVTLSVAVAREGDPPSSRRVLIAGGPGHLVLKPNLTFGYVPEPIDCPYQPSVDTFFESLARNWSRPSVAVLLTGMGRDGARGLLSLRKMGWYTIAQDQRSSAVFGMPKAAIDNQAVEETLPIEEIGSAILRHLTPAGETRRTP
jgi:two-component system response regulator WspF